MAKIEVKLTEQLRNKIALSIAKKLGKASEDVEVSVMAGGIAVSILGNKEHNEEASKAIGEAMTEFEDEVLESSGTSKKEADLSDVEPIEHKVKRSETDDFLLKTLDEMKKVITVETFDLVIEHLKRQSEDNDRLIKVIEKSIQVSKLSNLANDKK